MRLLANIFRPFSNLDALQGENTERVLEQAFVLFYHLTRLFDLKSSWRQICPNMTPIPMTVKVWHWSSKCKWHCIRLHLSIEVLLSTLTKIVSDQFWPVIWDFITFFEFWWNEFKELRHFTFIKSEIEGCTYFKK